MKDPAKYIVIEHYGAELPIIFHHVVEHAMVARGFRVLSAGFVDITNGVSVWGKSQSLGMESREEDKQLIERMLKD
ncbi:MAG: hypothetical protein DWQ19_13000 [Crenarchaeota archaeon]|nr:MAG: hypothetical protein DWQ19_13000 [Thermoproteota archaeon]